MKERNWSSYRAQCFPGQLRQRCLVHWMRNATYKVSKTDLFWLLPLIKDLVSARKKESFQFAWKELNRVAQSKVKDKLLEWLYKSYQEISVYLDFPTAHWSRIKCTNSLERLNEELRYRGNVSVSSWMIRFDCGCLVRSCKAIEKTRYVQNCIYQNLLRKIRENLKKAIPFVARYFILKKLDLDL